jgi:hypothetical protein
MADPQVVVVAEHFGDLLGRSDQRGGIAVGPGLTGDQRFKAGQFRLSDFVVPGPAIFNLSSGLERDELRLSRIWSSLRGAKRRSNPVFLAALDCFASLAMTELMMPI